MNDILDWSKGRPQWQQDALRRLLVNSEITDSDIQELTLACLADHKALEEGEVAPTMEPLSRSHVPTTSVSDEAVRIRSVANIKHANALAPDQTLELSPDGLTIIYGDNGAGKTGYARLLKHSGRARRCDKNIRSNVFEAPPSEPASATIHCQVGNAATVIEWKDGQQPDVLASVSSFDADCAAVHVNDPNTIDFTPFGLDLFSKLVSICKRVKACIGERVTKLEQARSNTVANPVCHEGTFVARKLQVLSANTDPRKLAEIGHIENKDVARIAEIEQILKSDPESKAKSLQTQANGLRRVLTELESVDKALNQQATQAFADLVQDAATKRSAAELHATQLVGSTPLSSVGTSPWMELWKAARKYSEVAQPDKNFPSTTDGDVCVLCQQELDDESKKRLEDFDEFVKNEAETAATKAEQLLKASETRLQQLNLTEEHWKGLIGELLADQEDLKNLVMASVETATEIRDRLIQRESESTNAAPAFSSHTHAQLSALVETWTNQAKELLGSVNPEERQTLQQELHELQDRQWLNQHYESFVDEITRLADMERLKTAEKSTNSTAISTKGGKLATTYVTDELTEKFAEEVKRLCGRDVNVSLGKGRSTNGVATYQISLNSTQDAKPNQVLSEGEFRCIAIAGFLTELSTSENRSTIVLDDPVSSLGHEWRSHIAARLVEESKLRQVVVFSHDMFFVTELARLATDEQVTLSTSHIVRSDAGVGLCRPNFPWFGATTLKRLELLNDRLEERRAEYESATEEARLEISTKFFSHMRETCERAVEREFIGGCMHRFENYIRVSRVYEATAFSVSDADKLHKVHLKCSNGLDGHDHAVSGRQTSPQLDDMISLVDELRSLIESVHAKRENLKATKRRSRPRSNNLFNPDF